MMLRLDRYEYSDEGTFGLLKVNDEVFVTGELPWRDNQRGKSCIPVGIYNCQFTFSPLFKKKTYHLVDVFGRTGIRIHKGNFCGDKSKGFKSEIAGCILLGKEMSSVHGQRIVSKSRIAVAEFEKLLQERPFTLVIEDFNTYAKGT